MRCRQVPRDMAPAAVLCLGELPGPPTQAPDDSALHLDLVRFFASGV